MNSQPIVPIAPKQLIHARNYVFGPVPSRRIGLSLGVDVIPKKLCNLDCVYCEVGRTDKRAMRRMEYLPAASILKEIGEVLATDPPVNFITFSGSGEPTLNSKLGEIIHAVKQMTAIPVAVITNGTLLSMDDVRQDLMEADVVLPSLDCVTAEMFQKVNRPHPKLSIGSVVQGLKLFRQQYKGQIWLEILLVKGLNDSDEEMALTKRILEELQPDKIQLNTVTRPPPDSSAQAVEEERMNEIRAMFGDRCEVIGNFASHSDLTTASVEVDMIMALLRRRAMTSDDLADAFQIPSERIGAILEVMEQNALVVPYRFHQKTYYRPIEYFFNGFCG